MDVLLASSADDTVAWYENDCVLEDWMPMSPSIHQTTWPSDRTSRSTAKSNAPQTTEPSDSTPQPVVTSKKPTIQAVTVQPTMPPDSTPQLPVKQTCASLKRHIRHCNPCHMLIFPLRHRLRDHLWFNLRNRRLSCHGLWLRFSPLV